MTVASPSKRPHTCHALGCDLKVPPKRLMCLKHWRMVPNQIQDQVWAYYRPGQEIDKRPTKDYLVAAGAAVQWVYEREQRESRRRNQTTPGTE
jgi:hypothetical protein